MKKEKYRAAVLMAPGFEEGETLTIIDLLRRSGIECASIYFDQPFVEGMHQIRIKADRKFSRDLEDWDILILPGGRPGGDFLLGSDDVIALVQKMNAQGKTVAAMCFGTRVLAKAGVIQGKKVTGYLGYEEILKDGQFVRTAAAADQNIVTGCGPATPYSFVFALLEHLGMDTEHLKYRMMYPA